MVQLNSKSIAKVGMEAVTHLEVEWNAWWAGRLDDHRTTMEGLEPLPPIIPEQLAAVRRSYGPAFGLGWNVIHPGALSVLPYGFGMLETIQRQHARKANSVERR